MISIDEHLTDEVISKAFHGTSFGRSDLRTILAETVLKRASGYHAGYTATTVCADLGLLKGKENKATRLGLTFAFHHYYKQQVRDVLHPQQSGTEIHSPDSGKMVDPECCDCEQMTLDEAITHATDKSHGDGQCAAQHAQLAAWLTEYRAMLASAQKPEGGAE